MKVLRNIAPSFLIPFLIGTATGASFAGLLWGQSALYPNPVAAQTLPATPGWSQIPNTHLRACPSTCLNFGDSGYDFAYQCRNVTEAWNSGVFDTTRNRLIVWGGGHRNYSGNEIYALDLNTLTMQRLTDPARRWQTTQAARSLWSTAPSQIAGKPTMA